MEGNSPVYFGGNVISTADRAVKRGDGTPILRLPSNREREMRDYIAKCHKGFELARVDGKLVIKRKKPGHPAPDERQLPLELGDRVSDRTPKDIVGEIGLDGENMDFEA